MTKFIVLSSAEAWSLFNDRPIKVYVDQIPHILCTEECYEKQLYSIISPIIKDESVNEVDVKK